MRRTAIYLAFVASVITACESNSEVVADANSAADAVQDAARPFCPKFVSATTVSSYPATLSGDLTNAGADLVVTGGCQDERSPFGIQSAGPESVVMLTNLTPRMRYAVSASAVGDLAIYIATGCDAHAKGPTRDQCLVFADEGSTGGEVLDFVAPGSGTAYLVVDRFVPGQLPDATFNLEVFQVQCDTTDISSCDANLRGCSDYRCVPCADSFDCTEATTPVCNRATNQCEAGRDMCTTDETTEPNNDGPAGAIHITPIDTVPVTVAGTICNDPPTELDYYTVTVADGEGLTIEANWDEPNIDIDITVTDREGVVFGASFYDKPENMDLTYLPAGEYLIEVNYFSVDSSPVGIDYTLTVTRHFGSACTSTTDCAANYTNQYYRGTCHNSGACRWIKGNHERALGAECDSDNDCESGLCSSFAFTRDSEQRFVCTHTCQATAGCADMGLLYVCTDYLFENVCVLQCRNHDHCPVLLSVPPRTPPWTRLACYPALGECGL